MVIGKAKQFVASLSFDLTARDFFKRQHLLEKLHFPIQIINRESDGFDFTNLGVGWQHRQAKNRTGEKSNSPVGRTRNWLVRNGSRCTGRVSYRPFLLSPSPLGLAAKNRFTLSGNRRKA